MHRSLLLLPWAFSAALAVGCADRAGVTEPANDQPALASAETVTNVKVVQVEFTDELLCTGELVHWTGTTQLVEHVTANRGVPPGFQHTVFIASTRLTGVGETSGATYRFFSNQGETFQSPDPVDPFPLTFTLTARDRIFGPDGGLLGLGIFSVKVVVNGNAELIMEDVDFTGQCR